MAENTNEVISVIVPVYNVEKYIDMCIRSILNQSYKKLEVLLIDDGSTDKSGTICDVYAQNDNRVKVFHKDNGGVSSARNLGLKRSTGAYVTFVDPDDWLEAEMLQHMLNAMQETHAQAAFCGFTERFCDATKEDILHSPACKGVVKGIEALYQCMNGIGNGYFSASWAKLFYKSSLYIKDSDLLYMKPYAIAEDELWLTQLVPTLKSVVLVPDAFYNWRQRKGSALHAECVFSSKWYDALKAKKEILQLLKKWPEFDDLAEAKIYSDMFHMLWQGVCYGTRQDYIYFKKELAPYKTAFYKSQAFSKVRKIKATVLDIMICFHFPKSWIKKLGGSTALGLKRKFRVK